jgi:hypothetical protein
MTTIGQVTSGEWNAPYSMLVKAHVRRLTKSGAA